jgi:hypothetical protein
VAQARDEKPCTCFASARSSIARRRGSTRRVIFDISRAKGYRDYVLTDPDYPLIPGTNVERLRLVHLGPKAAGVSDDEIRRVVTGLEDWYATKAAAQRATGKKNPPKNPPQLGEVRR